MRFCRKRQPGAVVTLMELFACHDLCVGCKCMLRHALTSWPTSEGHCPGTPACMSCRVYYSHKGVTLVLLSVCRGFGRGTRTERGRQHSQWVAPMDNAQLQPPSPRALTSLNPGRRPWGIPGTWTSPRRPPYARKTSQARAQDVRGTVARGRPPGVRWTSRGRPLRRLPYVPGTSRKPPCGEA